MISIIVPVYNSENSLMECLLSADRASCRISEPVEIVVISDCSPGKDKDGKNAKKITRLFSKKTNCCVKFINNRENRGTFESRRIGFYSSSGDLITFLDSDDRLKENALLEMRNAYLMHKADIIYCGAQTVPYEKFRDDKINRYYRGILKGQQEIQREWFENKSINAYMCPKLFTRELLDKVYGAIPYTECSMAEDLILYFFIFKFAETYFGHDAVVYEYYTESGITSPKKIETLEQAKKICSVSSVFTIIFDYLNQNNGSREEFTYYSQRCLDRIKTSIETLDSFGSSLVKENSYKILCEAWGKTLVDKVMKKLGR